MDDEELELTLLNLDFRIMLFEERCKDLETQMNNLLARIETVKASFSPVEDDDYWKADDA